MGPGTLGGKAKLPLPADSVSVTDNHLTQPKPPHIHPVVIGSPKQRQCKDNNQCINHPSCIDIQHSGLADGIVPTKVVARQRIGDEYLWRPIFLALYQD